MTTRVTHTEIVVGVDGSAPSTKAVRWAARAAAMRRVPLVIVNVRSALPVSTAAMGWAVAPIPQEVFDWQIQHAQTVVNDAEDIAHAAEPNVKVIGEVICGSVVQTLIDLSKDALMIVVGCRGLDAFQRGIAGSVSTGVIHHGHCPIAVVHTEPAAGTRSISHAPVLVGIDGSPASELATAIAFDEASFRGVDLIALHAWSDEDMSGFPGTDRSAVIGTARETLAERLAGWHERYPDVTVHPHIVLDHPVRHLLDQSAASQLVVVGSHGRGGFAGMLLGSVGAAVAHAAPVPVIIARQF
ncbi:universal stress protein [soil metagenome]